jgi:hypothetical protein
MHAAVLHLTIDPALAPAAAAAFTSEILPRVRAAPGFVAGYWLEPVDRQGFGFLPVRYGGTSCRRNTAGYRVAGAGGDDPADGCAACGSRVTLKLLRHSLCTCNFQGIRYAHAMLVVDGAVFSSPAAG